MTQQESWASSLHERLEISFVLVELSLTQKILYHMWKCYILLQDFFSELGIIYTFLEADLHYFRWHFFSHQNLYYLITNAVLLKSWGWDHLALNYHFSPMYFFFESSNTMFNFVNFTLISKLFVGARRGSSIVGSFNFVYKKQKNKSFFKKNPTLCGGKL